MIRKDGDTHGFYYVFAPQEDMRHRTSLSFCPVRVVTQKRKVAESACMLCGMIVTKYIRHMPSQKQEDKDGRRIARLTEAEAQDAPTDMLMVMQSLVLMVI